MFCHDTVFALCIRWYVLLRVGPLHNTRSICSLTHSPAMTKDGGMMAIFLEDHKLKFKALNSYYEDINGLVAIALGGRKRSLKLKQMTNATRCSSLSLCCLEMKALAIASVTCAAEFFFTVYIGLI